MQEVILVKPGELILKGLNKKNFEKKLLKNIKLKIEKFGNFEIKSSQSVISIKPLGIVTNTDDVVDALKNTFGIVSVVRSVWCEKRIDSIKNAVKNYLNSRLKTVETFKVETKRADKSFPLSSYQLSAEIGEFLLNEFNNLKVDVHVPDLTVYIEVRDFGVYVHATPVKGIGGLPYASCGKVLSLISGGIDSPVASFMLAKRGADVTMLHFVSPPYTGQRALDKVKSLIEKLNKYYMNKAKLCIANITQIQETIKKQCKEEFFTIIMRRFMMKIAENLALNNGCKAIATGESLGQVASQTLEALLCTNAACKILPVLRPLVGMDKDEIIDIAKKIDTFETSILPYEDCCTVFVPKHPKTKPNLEDILKEEEKLDAESLVNKSLENTFISETPE